MKLVIAVLLILHGLIVAGQAVGSFKPAVQPNPAWLSWWPIPIGRSWALAGLGLDQSPIATVGGLLYLAGGIALGGAGLAVLGFVVPAPAWRSLAIAGAAISLFMLLVDFHPILTIGVVTNIGVLVALLWAHWPPPALLGA